jgi:hypothetical protein
MGNCPHTPLGCLFEGALCHLWQNQTFTSKLFIVGGAVAILHFYLGNINMRLEGVVEMIISSEVNSKLRYGDKVDKPSPGGSDVLGIVHHPP